MLVIYKIGDFYNFYKNFRKSINIIIYEDMYIMYKYIFFI